MLGAGVYPAALVNRLGVAVILPPLGVTPAVAPEGVRSHLFLLGVSPNKLAVLLGVSHFAEDLKLRVAVAPFPDFPS